MANIDTSNMILDPYTPQAKPTKQEFLVIIPIRVAEDTAEIMRPTAQNIHATVANFIISDSIKNGVIYDYIYFNINNYFLIPLKRSNMPAYNVLFVEEENNNSISGSNSGSPFEPIEGAWYILHYIPVEEIDNEYFTPTGIYLSPDNLPMPDLSAWEPQVTLVPQNTVINVEDDITSYIYTENGWKVFANNTPNITNDETQLFIRGLVYGEDVEPHEDEGGTVIEEGEGGGIK